MRSNTSMNKFLDEVMKLNSVQFVGLARTLNVPLYTRIDPSLDLTEIKIEELPNITQPRDFKEILGDILIIYSKMDRASARGLRKLVRDSEKLKGDVNAGNT